MTRQMAMRLLITVGFFTTTLAVSSVLAQPQFSGKTDPLKAQQHSGDKKSFQKKPTLPSTSIGYGGPNNNKPFDLTIALNSSALNSSGMITMEIVGQPTVTQEFTVRITCQGTRNGVRSRCGRLSPGWGSKEWTIYIKAETPPGDAKKSGYVFQLPSTSTPQQNPTTTFDWDPALVKNGPFISLDLKTSQWLPGTYTLSAVIDSGNVVAESNENNNKAGPVTFWVKAHVQKGKGTLHRSAGRQAKPVTINTETLVLEGVVTTAGQAQPVTINTEILILEGIVTTAGQAQPVTIKPEILILEGAPVFRQKTKSR